MDILERVVFWLKDYELRIVYFLTDMTFEIILMIR